MSTEPMDIDTATGLSDVAHERYLAREAPISDVEDYLGYFDSHKRTERLVRVMTMMTAADRQLRIFLAMGSVCDAPWHFRRHLAGLLRRARAKVELSEVLEPAALKWHDALPATVEVNRGCERRRERGLSWTTDRTVAEGFAQGKRWVNRWPTLARAQVLKQHIFAVFVDRKESEIVLDPRGLQRLQIERIRSEYLKPTGAGKWC
jgi:hypothetical protein